MDFKLLQHTEKASGFLTKLNPAVPIILGLEWLRLHDPSISWAKNTVTFNSHFCRQHCLKDGHPITVAGLTKEDEQIRQPALAQIHATELLPKNGMEDRPSKSTPGKVVLDSSMSEDKEQPPSPGPVPSTLPSQGNKKKKEPRLPAKVVGGVRLPHRMQNRHPSPLPVNKSPNPERQEELESLDIRFIGAAPFAHLAKQKRNQISRIDLRHLGSHKALSEQDLLALNELKEQDFKKLLQGESTDEDKAHFPECFQSFIKDHEDKIFLNRVTEEDIDKFLETKEPLSKEEILKRLPPEYHEFVDVFPREADKLPPHRPFDHNRTEIWRGTAVLQEPAVFSERIRGY